MGLIRDRKDSLVALTDAILGRLALLEFGEMGEVYKVFLILTGALMGLMDFKV